MQILFEIDCFEKIKNYVNKVDGFIVGFESLTSFGASSFSFEELLEASKIAKIYVNLNMMMHVDDESKTKEILANLSKLDIHFIVQDLGMALLLKDLDLVNKTIFNPISLLTNSEDISEYLSFGFESVVASSEITVSDLAIISNKVNNVSALLFGYHPMYQSYRHIVDLYKEHANLDFPNGILSLKEFTRDYHSYVVDNKFGSVIFRHYVLSLIKEFSKLKNLKYLFVNTIFFNDDQFSLVVDTITKLEHNKLDEKEASRILENYFNIEDGFLYKDSIYDPKEF